MSHPLAWAAVILVLALTVYSQVVLKLRVAAAGPIAPGFGDVAAYLGRLLLDPSTRSCWSKLPVMRRPAGLDADHGPRLRRKERDHLRPLELPAQNRLFGCVRAVQLKKLFRRIHA